jgi:hypothetical protein
VFAPSVSTRHFTFRAQWWKCFGWTSTHL